MTDPIDGPARTSPLPDLVLYGKPGCGLCVEARETIVLLLQTRHAAGRPTPPLVERDIMTDPDWERAFFLTIPVVELADRRLELATSAARIAALMDDVLGPVPVGPRAETTHDGMPDR